MLEYEAGLPFEDEKVKDIQEVVNYRKTLTLASESISHRPLSLSLIRQMNGVLMDSVRGKDKSPGEFRTSQNLIGNTLQGLIHDVALFLLDWQTCSTTEWKSTNSKSTVIAANRGPIDHKSLF